MAADSAVGVTTRPVALMFGCVLLSWLGEYVHNLYELPDLTLLSPENSIPAMISLGLFFVWWRTRNELAEAPTDPAVEAVA